MSFLTSMQNRYTTKVYDATKTIDPKKIEDLKQILRLSPSSINSQPWKFTFVSDKTHKEALSKVSWLNTERVLHCDTVVVFSIPGSKEAFEKRIEKELPAGAFNYYKDFLQASSKNEINAWFARQVYLALGVFLAACANMGIDATPMEGIEPEEYDRVLNQKEHKTLVAVCIGIREKDDFNQPSLKPKSRRKIDAVVESI